MRTALVLLTTLFGYLGVENLIFNTGGYRKIVNPDSSTGQVQEVLYNEHHRLKIGDRQVLAIGDSRMGFFPRFINSHPGNPYTFASIAIAGSTPRDWFYMFRDIDPTRHQYAAILIPVENYDDLAGFENQANRETDLHYLIGELHIPDIPEFAGSYTTPSLQAKAALGILVKGSVYRADFQDMLADPRKRLKYVRQVQRDSFGWIYDYEGTSYNVSGIAIDWKAHTLLIPPGHRDGEREFFESRLFAPLAPRTGSRTAYLSHWFNRICDLYRGTRTRIIIFRLPRGPYPPPTSPPPFEHSSVRELARQPGVILDDEHYFDSLERPELFMDPMHFNAAGCAQFSTMLGKHVEDLLSAREK